MSEVATDTPSPVSGETTAVNGVEANTHPPLPPKQYVADIACSSGAIPPEVLENIRKLEKILGVEVWLFIQNGESAFSEIDYTISEEFIKRRRFLKDKKVALLINSPGGNAKAAYQISSVFAQHSAEFIAIVPRYAKSAATLMSLGAKEIVMGDCAELGPLDVQVTDLDREDSISALDEVHSIQRLNVAALEAVDQAMFLMIGRTKKKVETLLPMMLDHVSKMICPMIQKIDTVHYTQMSRLLKVAEEYAVRLLSKYYPKDRAGKIATALVEKYPEHGFYIGQAEARALGLNAKAASQEVIDIFDSMQDYLYRAIAVGRIIEKEEPK